LARMDRIELDDTGRSVASKERALRPTKNFDAGEVEGREALQDGVFEDHVIIDQADRLRGIEVEVGVAEAADVEAREGSAERAFNVEARDAPGEAADVRAAAVDDRQLLAIDGADRNGHVLHILSAALRGDHD